MAGDTLLGIDVGTTSVKAGIIAPDGAVLDQFSGATQRAVAAPWSSRIQKTGCA